MEKQSVRLFLYGMWVGVTLETTVSAADFLASGQSLIPMITGTIIMSATTLLERRVYRKTDQRSHRDASSSAPTLEP
jgi:hypothetical protein